MLERSFGLAIACAALALACRAASPVPGSALAEPASPRLPAHHTSHHQAAPPEQTVLAGEPPGDRLGGHIVPTAYELELAIDPAQPRFAGTATIHVDIREPVSTIWLHGKDLTIVSAVLRRTPGAGLARIPAEELEIELDAPRVAQGGLLGFDLPEVVTPGPAVLAIAYSAAFGTRVGAFRQSEGGHDYVYTDFEPIDARLAFPCFDEPRFKTPWTVTLVVPADMHGLSNMPERSVEPMSRGKKRIRFETSPPLPSYLVAFAVGPFDIVNARGEALVPLRIITPRGKAGWATTAATIAPELLRIVADYFGTAVPFPKLDMIAVPEFSGAMENPGLITVGAHILLSDPLLPSIAQQRFLALVCAHEFAHLWFGDLVTPEDWNELWLNEGFASWLADKALYAWNAGRMPHVDQVVYKAHAMALDEHIEARAVRQIGRARKDIEGAFDALSYKKGGALLAMFEAWLSEKTFRQGARSYVAAHAGGNVDTDRLLRALSSAAGRDVGAAFRSFLDQPGIPQVRAELRCEGGRPRVELSQRRYVLLSDRPRATPEAASALWHVPVCVRYGMSRDSGQGVGQGAGQDSGRACTLLSERTASLELDASGCPAWLVPNADAVGYFRYDMPPAQLAALARAPLSEREATELVHNLRALLYSGDIDLAQVLPMIEAVTRRASRHTHEAVFELLSEIGEHVLPVEGKAEFSAYVRRLYSKRARALGFFGKPGESEEDALLRPKLIAFAGDHGADPWVRGTAGKLAERWLRSGRGIERGMIEITLSLAGRTGQKPLYERVAVALRRAISERDPDRQEILFQAMGGFRQPELVARSLAMVEDPGMGKKRHHLLLELLEAAETREQAMRYLEDRQKTLARSWTSAYLLLAPLFAQEPCSERELARARAMASQIESARDMVSERLREIESRIRACDRFRDAQQSSARTFFR
jgi:cytosol alanyl aminopeptidase